MILTIVQNTEIPFKKYVIQRFFSHIINLKLNMFIYEIITNLLFLKNISHNYNYFKFHVILHF